MKSNDISVVRERLVARMERLLSRRFVLLRRPRVLRLNRIVECLDAVAKKYDL